MASWTPDPSIRDMIALIGSVAVVLLWLAPLRDVWISSSSIFATRSTTMVATAFGYVAGLFQCVLWDMYQVTRLDKMTVPFLVNIIGFCLNTSFVGCYWMFAVGKARQDVRNQFAVLAGVTILAGFIWITTGSNDSIGYIAAFVNVLMLFGPLAAARQIVKSRSTKGFPFPPLLLTLICSSVWFGYGLYILDVPIMIPNGMGVLFGIAQISLFMWARSQEKLKQQVSGIGEDGFEPISTSHDDTTSHDNVSLLSESDAVGIIGTEGPTEMA